MLDTTLHPSVLQCIFRTLPAACIVRIATCSKSLHRCVTTNRALVVPILRERLKLACWSLVTAGYCVNVRNALASYISCQPLVTVTYNDIERTVRVRVTNFRAFGEVLDKYVLTHADAILQRAKSPAIRQRQIEKHFARCAEQLRGVGHNAVPHEQPYAELGDGASQYGAIANIWKVPCIVD